MAPHASPYTSSDQESLSSLTDYSDQLEYSQNDECVPNETVAIVGMGCRWPGGVSTPSQLWDLLANSKSGYRDFDDTKFNIASFYHPNPQRPGSTPARGAYQLHEDPKLFDHSFFGITPTETLTLDPQHRKLLEVVYEAFENAGEPWEKFSGSRTGVFVGNFTADHNIMQSREIDNLLPYATTGGSTSILSNRINYIFNLHGPSLTLDTACSSSLYALHLAVNAIKNGDCDSAIVGAGNLILSPELHISLSKLGALSPSATCHVFDAAADGYARGEGFAAFYLKKTSDAIAGAYPIRSVIRGTAINSNGRTAGITHPSADGQAEVILQAYANAGLDPSMTGYFEAHGTGTQVGDPTEINAIGQVFSKYFGTSELRIGSIKSNIGHTEAASGMAGLMKSILAMEHGLIPPTIGIDKLNTRINFKASRVRPVTRLEPWPTDRLKRVSINSFGYGGANGHCILDDVSVALPGYARERKRRLRFHPHHISHSSNGNRVAAGTDSKFTRALSDPYSKSRRMVVLPFSAHEETALKDNVNAICKALRDHELGDLAYTLSHRRSKFKYRTYRVVDSEQVKIPSEMKVSALSRPCSGRKPNIGLVFTGQGAQWQGMGADLLEFAFFRNAIEKQDQVLSSLSNAPSWSIHNIISGKVKGNLHEPLVSQTVCTALQIAMVDLLHKWKIEWSASVGHSSGEIAAAYAAGIITAAEAITIAYCRGLAVASNRRSGLMLAVGLGRDDVEPYLENFRFNMKIAAINSPESVTLSGDTVAVMELYEILLGKGVFAKVLQTGRNAYHSHHMASIGETYVALLDKALKELSANNGISLSNRYLKAEWFSSATPEKPNTSTVVDTMYWRWNLQAPVQFSRAVENMMTLSSSSVDVLVEIGPHSALKSPLRQIFANIEKEFAYLSTLRRHEDGRRNMLALCGELFCMGANIDLVNANSTDSINEFEDLICIDLPKYTYNYGPIIYHENRLSKENRQRKYLRHDILGSKQLGCSELRPSWRNVLKIKDVPWLAHHKLAPQTVFPASAYICMAIEAATQFFNGEEEIGSVVGFTIRNLSLKAALVIPEDDSGAEIVLNLDASKTIQIKNRSTWYGFTISSIAGSTDNWTENCSGLIMPHVTKQTPSRMVDDIDRRTISAAKWYQKFSEVCLEYGDSFQGLSGLISDPAKNIAQGQVALKTTASLFTGPESSYIIHPAALDMCAQLALIAVHGGQVEQMTTAYVPSFIGEMSIWATESQEHCYGSAIAKGTRQGLRGAHAQAQLVNVHGEVMLDISDIRCTAYSGGQKDIMASLSASSYMRLVWKPYLEKISYEQSRSMFLPMRLSTEMKGMFADVDRLGVLMLSKISERYGAHNLNRRQTDHFQKFLAWVERMKNVGTSEAQEAPASSTERELVIEHLCAKLHKIIEVSISKRILDNLEHIFSGEKSSLELVRQDEAHSQMYNSGWGISAAYTQLERVVDLLAHANPNMKILEIGAGTGGATRVALKTLCGYNYLRRYDTYTFTDVSSGYFPEARKEFFECHGLDFGVLDIEKKPIIQGFEPVYDLVIASCSIHVTKDINLTLSNAHSLLKPGGKLVILECTKPRIMHGLVLGTLPDYWVGTEEARKNSPFLPVSEWQIMLRKTGFSGIDIELDDYAQPYTMISTFLSSALAVQTSTSSPLERAISLTGPTTVHIVSFLRSQPATRTDILPSTHYGGPRYLWHDYSDILPEGSRIMALYDSGSSPTNSESKYEAIKRLLSRSKSVFWVNIADSATTSYPYAGVIAGLLRVMAAEYPSVPFASMNIGKADLHSKSLMNRILELEEGVSRTKGTSTISEYQVIDGIIHINRLVSDDKLNNLSLSATISDIELLPIGDKPPLAACFATPGILSSVYFAEDQSFWRPLEDDQIEVRTAAVGLNWKDLAVSAGRLDLDNFSSECSGIVTKVGKAVNGFKIGDKVFGISKGKFGNYMRCHSTLMRHMHTDDFVAAAAIPVVFMTAIYALSSLARVEPGEKLLIQSASGGLGIAAFNLALQLGADIWVTVGTEEKRIFLQQTYGIPDVRILSSKTPPSVEAIHRATGGSGFDIIMSTCSGDSLREWLACLAPVGRFIDVGRVDVQNHASLALEVFKRNATFSSFDLGILIKDKPVLCSKLLSKAAAMLRDGTVQQIAPIKTFDIAQLAPALLYLSKGVHMGKVVITYNDPCASINMLPSRPVARFDPEAKYLLVGGLGGLGRSIIDWMAQRGAKNFITISRSVPDGSTRSFLSRMTTQGCFVEHICCDVSKLTQVEAAIVQASESGDIKGIIHTAVSLQDKLFESLSFSEWQRGLSVKVDGTINLHKASLNLPLDHFVLISSNVAQIALPTQATYCASNNFQNEFARYRRSLGMPAVAVELGLIEEAGDLGQNPVYHNATMRNGFYHTSEHGFLQHLDFVFSNTSFDRQTTHWTRYDACADAHLITSLDPTRLQKIAKEQRQASSNDITTKFRWQSDVRFSHIVRSMENITALHEVVSDKTGTQANSSQDAYAALSEIDALIGSKDINAATSLIIKSIVARMADMLFISVDSIDPVKGVAAYGMDSLIAAELRNWFLGAYKCTISFLKLLDTATSIKELADIVVETRVTAVNKA